MFLLGKTNWMMDPPSYFWNQKWLSALCQIGWRCSSKSLLQSKKFWGKMCQCQQHWGDPVIPSQMLMQREQITTLWTWKLQVAYSFHAVLTLLFEKHDSQPLWARKGRRLHLMSCAWMGGDTMSGCLVLPSSRFKLLTLWRQGCWAHQSGNHPVIPVLQNGQLLSGVSNCLEGSLSSWHNSCLIKV